MECAIQATARKHGLTACHLTAHVWSVSRNGRAVGYVEFNEHTKVYETVQVNDHCEHLHHGWRDDPAAAVEFLL